MNIRNIVNIVIIITGASEGIGQATAKLLSKHRVKLSIVSRSKQKLENLSKELSNSLVVPADLTKIPEIKMIIQKTKEHFGRIDVLINNAGQGYDAL